MACLQEVGDQIACKLLLAVSWLDQIRPAYTKARASTDAASCERGPDRTDRVLRLPVENVAPRFCICQVAVNLS